MKFVVREIIKEDIPVMYKWAKDPEIARYSDGNPNESQEDFSNRYHLYFSDGNEDIKIFSILLDNQLIGRMELGIDRVHKSALFGIIIGEKEYWNKGIGTKSLHVLFNYGFNNLGLNRMACEVYDFNKRSINLMKRVGMHLDGELREAEYVKDQFVNVLVFSILSKEFLGGE